VIQYRDGRFRIAWDSLDDAFKPEYWLKSIFSFREVLTCPNVLLAWVHGSAVQHMESLTDFIIKKDLFDITKSHSFYSINFTFWQSRIEKRIVVLF
jgi:hypothetical protein